MEDVYLATVTTIQDKELYFKFKADSEDDAVDMLEEYLFNNHILWKMHDIIAEKHFKEIN